MQKKKLKDIYGLELPRKPTPLGAIFSFTRRVGNLLYVTGQIPTYNDELLFTGRLGADFTIEQGQQAARYCMLNLLAIIKDELNGFEKIDQFVNLLGFVQSTDDFHNQTQVMNGASQMLIDLFGDEIGRPIRMAIGSNALPMNAPVEIMLMVELKSN